MGKRLRARTLEEANIQLTSQSLPLAVREEVWIEKIPCGFDLEHRFFDATGKIQIQEHMILTTHSFAMGLEKGEEVV